MSRSTETRIAVFSKGMRRIPFLGELLGEEICFPGEVFDATISAAAGWGLRPSMQRAKRYAERYELPLLSLEDGFLRSYGTGEGFPPVSIVVDEFGIYFDSTRPSALERLLESKTDLIAGIEADVDRAVRLIVKHRLSKYNHAPDLSPGTLGENDVMRVLVIDQTFGDSSVVYGDADERSFMNMLEAALEENPLATVYVKTHPEVISGRKKGYLTGVQEIRRVVFLRQAIDPYALVAEMDRVYTVSSTMAFEALLAGKPVTCFGMPWYAGWGVTDDRCSCGRRTKRRSVSELFAAAYMHYARYLDPVTHRRGSLFDVIGWLVRQREMADRYPGRMICQGFRKWKAVNVRPFLSLNPQNTLFAKSDAEARQLRVGPEDLFVRWGIGGESEPGVSAPDCGPRRLCMEDGFVRSVGLGSDLILPLSVVLDERGIYFDPNRPSDLENLLNAASFTAGELAEAERVRRFIVTHGITKYNIDTRRQPTWQTGGRRVVFVPGQVEDDASILFGSRFVRTNMELLRKVRESLPEAFIVYKPHPDVLSGNRSGRVMDSEIQGLADVIEPVLSAVSCIEAAEEVHTMTSLTGFDALLRRKRVIVYGEPFYAGWGLTVDTATDGVSFRRRNRRLTLDELVAGAFLRYPIYWDSDLRGYTSCIAVLHRIRDERVRLEANGKLEKLRVGSIRRQLRKLSILCNAMLAKA